MLPILALAPHASATPSSAAWRQVYEQPEVPPPADLAAALGPIEERTRELARLDAYAWEATDRLTEGPGLEGVEGWVTTVGEDGGAVVHFLQHPERPREVCRVVFAPGDARGVAECPKRPARVKDEGLALLFRARQAAVADPRFVPRVERYNTEALVDPAGGYHVFLLPARMDLAQIPVLGAWRAHVLPDGTTVDAMEPLSVGAMSFPALKGDGIAVSALTHVLGPTPNEGHTFTTARYDLDLVVWADPHLWRVADGGIAHLGALEVGDGDPGPALARALVVAGISPPAEVNLSFLDPDLKPMGEVTTAPVGPLAADAPAHGGMMHASVQHGPWPGAPDYGALLASPPGRTRFLVAPTGNVMMLATADGDGIKVVAYRSEPGASTLKLLGQRGPFVPVLGPAPSEPLAACPGATAPPADVRHPFGDPGEDWLGYWSEPPLEPVPGAETWRLFLYPSSGPWRMVRVDAAASAAVVRRAAAASPGLAVAELVKVALPEVSTREVPVPAERLAFLRDVVSAADLDSAPPPSGCPGVDGARWVLEIRDADGTVRVGSVDQPSREHPIRAVGTALLLLGGEPVVPASLE